MRRSFGPGMGGGGGGRGGGGTMKTVHRAVRAGLGGCASQEPYSHSATTTTKTTTSNRNQPINTTTLSLSSNPSSPRSYYSHPVLGPPTLPALSTYPTAGEEFEWEYIHGDDGESSNRVIYDDFVFGSVPSLDEVHHAVSSLQEVIDPTNFPESGSEIDWIEPSLQPCNSTNTLHDPRSSTRVYDAFHVLQTDPSVQRMVISLSSDKAVWDAVMKNEVVRELRELLNEGKSISEWSDDSSVDDDSNPVTQVFRWFFVNAKEKAIEIVEKITKILNALVQPMSEDEKPKNDTDDVGTHSFEEKLRSSFLLSVMVLLVVVVSRAGRGKPDM